MKTVYLTYLPSFRAYRDRCHQIRCLGVHFDEVVLVFNNDQDAAPPDAETNVTVQTLFAGHRRGMATLCALARLLWRTLRENRDATVVIDDWFHFLSMFYPLLRTWRGLTGDRVLLVASPVVSSWFWFTDNRLSVLWLCRDYSWLRLRKIPFEFYSYVFADVLAVQSEGLRVRYRRTFPSKPIIVVRNAVERPISRAPGESVEGVKPPTPLRLVYAGNLSYHKGIDLILDLVAADHSGRYAVAVAGEGARREGRRISERLARSPIAVRGRLTQDELRLLYDASDILILPTRHEGLPRVVLEFLALAKPVVATDLVGLSDIESPLLVRFCKGDAVAFRKRIETARQMFPLPDDVLARNRDTVGGFSAQKTAHDKAEQIQAVLAAKFEGGR